MTEPMVIEGVEVGKVYPLALIKGDEMQVEVEMVDVVAVPAAFIGTSSPIDPDTGETYPEYHPQYEEPQFEEMPAGAMFWIHCVVLVTSHPSMMGLCFKLDVTKFHELVLEASWPTTEKDG